MRILTAAVIPVLFFAIFLSTNSARAATGQTVSGRLVFENGDFACDHCVVSLLANGVRPISTTYANGVRPISTTYADLSGHFAFASVPAGAYTIHVEIDGFEDVNQQIDTGTVALEANVLITLVRKRPKLTSGGKVVNISEFLELYPKKAVSFFEKGTDAMRDNKNADAVKYFREAIELAPTFYEAHNQLGMAYKLAGRTDDAEREFLKAHELNSTSVDPLLNLTGLYLDENQPDRAVNTGEEAVKANSHSAPAFFDLGVALYKTARFDRAETALKRALELAPKMAAVRLMLANVYVKLRRYDNTLEQLNAYISENPHGAQLAAAQQMRDQLLALKETQQP
jgi:tetratricopeptide (TPR) repeat protein